VRDRGVATGTESRLPTVGDLTPSPARHDRPVRILLGVVASALVLSVVIPFTVVSIREGSVGSGVRWVWEETGIVGALIGCALGAPVIRKWRTRRSR
jgi:hypothetical protein